MTVRVDRDTLTAFSEGREGDFDPRKVSELLRLHADCEGVVRDLRGRLKAATQEVATSKSRLDQLETRYQSLLNDHMELLAERKRLEGRLQALHRRRADLKAGELRSGTRTTWRLP